MHNICAAEWKTIGDQMRRRFTGGCAEPATEAPWADTADVSFPMDEWPAKAAGTVDASFGDAADCPAET